MSYSHRKLQFVCAKAITISFCDVLEGLVYACVRTALALVTASVLFMGYVDNRLVNYLTAASLCSAG
jgi:hypothetical protein